MKNLPLLIFLALLAACTSTPSDNTPYRDLNKNGKMDVYEDPSQPIEARVNGLLQQMTVEEKAGLLFIDGTGVPEDGAASEEAVSVFGRPRVSAVTLLKEKHMAHFNIWSIPSVEALAKWYNNIQKVAEESRLGIPVTIASDPRHYFSRSIFAMEAQGFSQWPEQLGFAATGDTALMREFADIARQEYLAVGIREALHPSIDLATEPRWARVSGTFGEDAELSARLAKAYILGFQGEQLDSNGVACMTKHFPGGGPQKEGLDPHFAFHKGQVYPGGNFGYHLIPFEAAFEAGTAAIMPYYGVPTGLEYEEVGFAYNKAIITGLLREKYGYDGVVCTDWGLVTDEPMGQGVVWNARAWGVEELSTADRVLRIIEAGADQFGGEAIPEVVVQLVNGGRLSEERLNESVRRLLRVKFRLGLFDNPYINLDAMKRVVGKPEFVEAGNAAQRRAMTLLKNEDNLLPLQAGTLRLYVENLDSTAASQYGTVVTTPEEADLAIIRLNTPWYPVETNIEFARGFHHGDLDFKGAEKEKILNLLNTVPTIVDIYLDRPAVIPEINARAKAVLANYGASDAAVLDVIFGIARPKGKLPFELPSSMEAVRNQKPDVPHDSEAPLYEFGHGLSY
ncbi:MAG: glycoside hydrolase family 3 C-terminal domain-containing protein [Phaeodactylibacter sp.]|nr:glycoside hydrolase family 3 C-terminal domain-containing protein [Phaeodactylibacter sp.]